MKKLVVPACMVVILSMAGCAKNKRTFTYSGTLTGPDPTMTACSGGVFFNTENKIYHIDSLPGMRVNELYRLGFPVSIQCNGHATGKCVGLAQDGYFTVSAYRFQQ